MGAGGDHRAVVGAEHGRRREDRHRRAGDERLAQRAVGGDAAGEQQAAGALAQRGLRGLLRQHVDDGRLERGGHVGHRRRLAGFAADGVQDGGLEAAEAEVVAALSQARGRRRPSRRASRAGRSTAGPPGKPSPSSAADLVEGFAGGVVARAAEAPVVAVAAHQHEVGVAAGDDQAERRQLGTR